MLIQEWESEVLDVTTVFSYGDMEDEVCLKCLEGIELVEDGWNREEDCTDLLRTIHGTKQAARQHWKKFMAMMKKKGFEGTILSPNISRFHISEFLVKRSLKLGHVSTSTRPSATALPGS
jgi:hypothetical protein